MIYLETYHFSLTQPCTLTDSATTLLGDYL
jgi:hypothetical protein